MTFSEMAIDALSAEIKSRLSPKRFEHTLGVVRAACDLSRYCLPDKLYELKLAAYLHDVTKELPLKEHYEILSRSGVLLAREDMNTEAVLHSYSGACIVKRDFPNLATDDVVSAVYNHTLGSPDMTVFDEIIFLADYIEDTRIYESSMAVRKFVLEGMRDGCTSANVKILHEACIKAIDNTILHLIQSKKAINSKNILTRNALLGKI